MTSPLPTFFTRVDVDALCFEKTYVASYFKAIQACSKEVQSFIVIYDPPICHISPFVATSLALPSALAPPFPATCGETAHPAPFFYGITPWVKGVAARMPYAEADQLLLKTTMKM